MPQETERVERLASDSALEAFPRLFVLVLFFFLISHSFFTFSDKFRRELTVSLVTLKFEN